MARKTSAIEITVDGKRAQEVYKAHAELIAIYTERLEKLKAAGKANSDEFRNLEKSLKGAEKNLADMTKRYMGLQNVMENLSGARIGDVSKAIKDLEKNWRNLNSDDTTGKNTILNQLSEIRKQDALNKSLFSNFEESMTNIDSQTQNVMRSMREYAVTMRGMAVEGSTEWEKYNSALEMIEQKLNRFGKRSLNQAEMVNNPMGFNKEELTYMVEQMQRFKDSMNINDSNGIKAVEADIMKLKMALEESKLSGIKLDDILANIGNNKTNGTPIEYSITQLDQAYKILLQRIRETPGNDSHLNILRDQAADLKLHLERASREVIDLDNVISNLGIQSEASLRIALERAKQLRQEAVIGSDDWNYYGIMIADIEKTISQSKLFDERTNEVVKNPFNFSTNEIKGTISELEKLKGSLDISDTSTIKTVDADLKKLKETLKETELVGDSLTDIFNDPKRFSVSQIEKAIDILKNKISNTAIESPDLPALSEQMKSLQEIVKGVGKEMIDLDNVLNNLGEQSEKSLSEAKKQAEQLREEAVIGSYKWEEYNDIIIKIEKAIAGIGADSYRRGEIIANPFQFSKSEITQTISELEKLKVSLNIGDTDSVTKIENDIHKLKSAILQSEEAGVKLEEILSSISDNKSNGRPIEYSITQLSQALDILNRKIANTDVSDPNLKKLQTDAEILTIELNKSKRGIIDITEVVNNLKSTPFNTLKKAAEQLKDEIEGLEVGSKKYVDSSKDYHKIKKQLDEVTRSVENQDGKMSGLIKRALTYMGVYGSAGLILGKMKEMVSENLKMTDALGGIRKTTGLTIEEVKVLSQEIDSMDTRTSQEALHQLAYEAGKLGIEGTENIMQFVRAGNIIKVALGDDLGEESIMKLMKLNNVMGLTATMGLEKSLLATGSALNELAAKSEASGDYMIDFASRVAPVGRTMGWTADQILALGATMEAMGQNAEMSATSTSKILLNLEANALDVSSTLSLNYSKFVELIRTKPVEAFRLMAEKAKEAGDEIGRANFVKIFTKDLGSEEATRMIQVLNAMIDGQDKLTYNLFYGSNGMKEASSATNEYNIMNETAAAVVERMNESIKEFFVNASNATGGLGLIVKVLASAVKWFFDTKIGVELLAFAIAGAGAAWVAFKVKTELANSSLRLAIATSGTLVQRLKLLTTTMGGWITIGIAVGTTIYGLVKGFGALSGSQSRAADTSKKFHESVGKEISELNRAFEPLKKLKEGTAEYNTERTKIINKYSEILGLQREEITNLTKQADLYALLRKRIIEKGMAEAMSGAQTEANKAYWDEYGQKMYKVREILSKVEIPSQTGKTLKITEEAINGFMNRISKKVLSGEYAPSILSEDPVAKYVDALKKSDISQIIFYLQKSYLELNKEMQKIENLYSTDRTVEEDWKNKYTTLEKALQKYAELKQRIKNIQTNPEKKDPSALNIDVEKTKKDIQELETFMTNVFGWNVPKKREKSKTKEYIETALAEIKSYYERREQENRKLHLNEEISKEEMDRRMEQNEMQHLNSRIFLLKEFTDLDKNTNAQWLLEKGIISEEAYNEMNGFIIKERKDREKYIATMEADKNKELEIRKRRIDAIRKLIEESDPILKRQRELSSDLQTTFGNQLFTGDKESNEERVRQLDEFGRAMSIHSVSQQNEWLKNHAQYGEMLKNLTQEEYDALLIILKKHNVEYEKIINESNPIRGLQKSLEENLTKTFGDKLFTQEKKENERRLLLLQEIAVQRSVLNDQGFEKWISQHQQHYSMLKSLDNESQTALLLMLRKYNEDVNNEIEKSYNDQLKSSKEYRDLMIRQEALKDEEKTVTGRKGNNFNSEADKLGIQSSYTATFISLKREELEIENTVFQSRMEKLKMELLSKEEFNIRKTELEQLYGENIKRINSEIEDSEVKLAMTQVSLMEKRAQDMGKFTSIMGNYFGEMAAARNLDDPEERAKAEEEAEQEMIKSMLKTTIQMITEWAMRATMKMAFDQLMVASGTAAAVADVTTEAAATGAKMSLFAALGFGKEVSTKGWIGLVTGAAVMAAIIGLSAWAMSSVDGMFPKAKTPNASKEPEKKKLAPGMLTYADGNVDHVLGNDGITYTAKHQKQFSTGIYDKPHYGIVGEAGPELIISSPATRIIMRDYPGIANAIKTISETGSLPQYRTYASGNERELLKYAQQEPAPQQVIVNPQLEQTNLLLIETIVDLKKQLSQGIYAKVQKYGKGGIDEANRDIKAFNYKNRRI